MSRLGNIYDIGIRKKRDASHYKNIPFGSLLNQLQCVSNSLRCRPWTFNFRSSTSGLLQKLYSDYGFLRETAASTKSLDLHFMKLIISLPKAGSCVLESVSQVVESRLLTRRLENLEWTSEADVHGSFRCPLDILGDYRDDEFIVLNSQLLSWLLAKPLTGWPLPSSLSPPLHLSSIHLAPRSLKSAGRVWPISGREQPDPHQFHWALTMPTTMVYSHQWRTFPPSQRQISWQFRTLSSPMLGRESRRQSFAIRPWSRRLIVSYQAFLFTHLLYQLIHWVHWCSSPSSFFLLFWEPTRSRAGSRHLLDQRRPRVLFCNGSLHGARYLPTTSPRILTYHLSF